MIARVRLVGWLAPDEDDWFKFALNQLDLSFSSPVGTTPFRTKEAKLLEAGSPLADQVTMGLALRAAQIIEEDKIPEVTAASRMMDKYCSAYHVDRLENVDVFITRSLLEECLAELKGRRDAVGNHDATAAEIAYQLHALGVAEETIKGALSEFSTPRIRSVFSSFIEVGRKSFSYLDEASMRSSGKVSTVATSRISFRTGLALRWGVKSTRSVGVDFWTARSHSAGTLTETLLPAFDDQLLGIQKSTKLFLKAPQGAWARQASVDVRESIKLSKDHDLKAMAIIPAFRIFWSSPEIFPGPKSLKVFEVALYLFPDAKGQLIGGLVPRVIFSAGEPSFGLSAFVGRKFELFD